MNTKNTWSRQQQVPAPGSKLLLLCSSAIRSFGSHVLPVAIFHVGPSQLVCDRVLMLTTSVQRRSSDFGIRDKMTLLICTKLLHGVTPAVVPGSCPVQALSAPFWKRLLLWVKVDTELPKEM